jgi:hypothetical protein
MKLGGAMFSEVFPARNKMNCPRSHMPIQQQITPEGFLE